MRAKLLVLLAALLMPAAVSAQGHCRDTVFEGASFTICEVTTNEDLRLFLNDPAGQPYGGFNALQRQLAAGGERLVFAMNAGMYHPDRRPVGLYIENGTESAGIVTRAGPGNFGLLPNGVFCIREGGDFAVVESRSLGAEAARCRYASQSGPMLVIDGALHPRFLPDSESLNTRNGVGVDEDGQTAFFVMANSPVNFHRFARFFRDELPVTQALYFDGNVSRLYAPELRRNDWGRPLGPIVGLVAPR